jgi:hypothetical protein
MKGKIGSTGRQRNVVLSFGARSANQMKPAEPTPCAMEPTMFCVRRAIGEYCCKSA